MEKLEVAEQTPGDSDSAEKAGAAIFIPGESMADSDPGVVAQVTEIKEQIAAALESAAIPHQVREERLDAQSVPDAPSMEDATFLDRYPTLGKFARSIMLVAGIGVAGAASAKDNISVEQSVGGSAVSVWSGNEVITGKTVALERKAEGGTQKQLRSMKPNTSHPEVEATVTINGKHVSATKSPQVKTIVGATITDGGKTIVIEGRANPLAKNATVEVVQKMDKVEGSVVGVKLK